MKYIKFYSIITLLFSVAPEAIQAMDDRPETPAIAIPIAPNPRSIKRFNRQPWLNPNPDSGNLTADAEPEQQAIYSQEDESYYPGSFGGKYIATPDQEEFNFMPIAPARNEHEELPFPLEDLEAKKDKTTHNTDGKATAASSNDSREEGRFTPLGIVILPKTHGQRSDTPRQDLKSPVPAVQYRPYTPEEIVRFEEKAKLQRPIPENHPRTKIERCRLINEVGSGFWGQLYTEQPKKRHQPRKDEGVLFFPHEDLG